MNSVFTALVPAVQVWWGNWWTSGDGATWDDGYGGNNGGGYSGGGPGPSRDPIRQPGRAPPTGGAHFVRDSEQDG